MQFSSLKQLPLLLAFLLLLGSPSNGQREDASSDTPSQPEQNLPQVPFQVAPPFLAPLETFEPAQQREAPPTKPEEMESPGAPPRGVRGSTEEWDDVRVLEVLERFQQERDKLRAERRQKVETQRLGLKRFGSGFFERSKVDELAETEPTTAPEDYRLQTGDELEASFYNIKGGSSTRSIVVDETGTADLAGLGPIPMGGMTRAQAEDRLNSALASSRLRNLQARLRIVKLSKIRVFVVGEAQRPGGYLVSPGSSALDVLLKAGGPTANGSFRNISVKRSRGSVASLDIYQLLLNGNVQDIRLQPGDKLFIPVSGPQVTVLGEVQRPAIYEIQGRATLPGLLRLAGGPLPSAYAPSARIERYSANRVKELVEVPLDSATPIRAGDTVIVQSLLDEASNGVYLDGAVKRPGWYPIASGARVSDLLQRAQGMSDGAYPGQAELFRREEPSEPIQMLGFDVGAALRGDPENNLRLRPDDVIFVYDRQSAEFDRGRVRVQGQVSRPGEYPRHARMRVRDLLLLAGGTTPEASTRAEIARPGPNGSLQFLPIDIRQVLESPQAPDNLALADGDALVVRSELRARRWPASVRLIGEFAYPGVYNFDPSQESLQSLIQRAGGVTSQAFLPAAVLTREKPDLISAERERISAEVLRSVQEVADQFAEAEMVRQGANRIIPKLDTGDTQQRETQMTPEELEALLRSRRIPLDLQQVLTSGVGDPGLVDGDVLYLPQRPRTVTIAGAVNLPSPFIHVAEKRLGDYIADAGGFTKDAEQGDIMVLRVTGQLRRADKNSKLEPGDVIVVPNKAIIAEPGAFDRFLSILQAAASGAFVFRAFR